MTRDPGGPHPRLQLRFKGCMCLQVGTESSGEQHLSQAGEPAGAPGWAEAGFQGRRLNGATRAQLHGSPQKQSSLLCFCGEDVRVRPAQLSKRKHTVFQRKGSNLSSIPVTSKKHPPHMPKWRSQLGDHRPPGPHTLVLQEPSRSAHSRGRLTMTSPRASNTSRL